MTQEGFYKVAKSDNQNYWMSITCKGHGLTVVADLPEQFTYAVQSDWESRLPYRLSSLFGSIPLVGRITDVVGNDPQAQALSFQMWTGTAPLEFPVTLLFDAEESALIDVFTPMTHLASLAMPNNGNGMVSILWPPGPRWGDQGDQSYAIEIRFGRMALFSSCIMISATPVFDTRLGDDGYPISGQIEMVFRTSKVYGVQDFLEAMHLKSLPGGGANMAEVDTSDW